MRRLLAAAIVGLAALILPSRHGDWGRAMIAELGAIPRADAALGFALGCLAGALRQAWPRHPLNLDQEGLSVMDQERRHPRRLATLCAIGATGLGLAYLAAAGAPPSYLAVNAAALAIGLLAIGVATEVGKLWRIGGGIMAVVLACLILFTALFGVSADGVTRWLSIGGLPLQPGLILVPVIALGVAQSRGAASLVAVLIAALALALQPDRAMAGALALAMAALAVVRPERRVLIALGAALAGFAVTLVRPDASPAMPFVDGVFYSSFAVRPLAGLAVLTGAVLMLVPAIAGYLMDPDRRASHAAFGAVWLAVILAAALGNYPTPLVGYGGSAILGYLLSLLYLPPRGATRTLGRGSAPGPQAEDHDPHFRATPAAAG